MTRKNKNNPMAVEITKIIKLRKAAFFTKSGLSLAMNYNRPHICQIERGERPFTPASLTAFKQVLDIIGVPVTENEIEMYKNNELNDFKNLLLDGKLNKATEQVHILCDVVKNSLDDDLQRWLDLYLAIYYRMAGDIKACDNVLSKLKEQEDDFSHEESYWYHKALGGRAIIDYQYRLALTEFLECKALKKKVIVKDSTLPLAINYCLSAMGYSLKAIKILKKEVEKSLIEFGMEYMVPSLDTLEPEHRLPIQIQLAANYRNVGHVSKSLRLLERIKLRDQDKIELYKLEGLFHMTVAESYQELGDFDNAIENMNTALEHVEHNKEQHAFFLYKKAALLAAFKKFNDFTSCLNEGLAMYSSDETLVGLLLNMLKHSVNIKGRESLTYLQKTIIPKLKQRGLYLEVANLYTKMGEHCSKSKLHKNGLIFYRQAYIISQKLWQGDLQNGF